MYLARGAKTQYASQIEGRPVLDSVEVCAMRWLRTSWDAIWLWVDWHGRITTVVVIIVALGGAALVNRAASVWGEVHGFYLYVISGLAFAIFLATIAILGRRIEAQEKARRSVRLEQSEDAETKPV